LGSRDLRLNEVKKQKVFVRVQNCRLERFKARAIGSFDGGADKHLDASASCVQINPVWFDFRIRGPEQGRGYQKEQGKFGLLCHGKFFELKGQWIRLSNRERWQPGRKRLSIVPD
jgi:hypothetical protein